MVDAQNVRINFCILHSTLWQVLSLCFDLVQVKFQCNIAVTKLYICGIACEFFHLSVLVYI